MIGANSGTKPDLRIGERTLSATTEMYSLFRALASFRKIA